MGKARQASSLISRLIRLFMVLPLLTLTWGYANALGVTDVVNNAAGINLPTNFKIPYVDQKWATGAKDIPHPAIIARETLREAGRERLDKAAVEAAMDAAKKAGMTAKEMKQAYQEGVAESEKKFGLDKVKETAAAKAKPKAKKTTAPKAKPKAKKTTAPKVTGAQKEAQTAYAIVKKLPVKGRAPKTGYNRNQFGAAWTDAVDVPLGRNGCDTRNDILKRDLSKVKFKSGSKCKVASGVLAVEPYTGAKNVKFIAGGAYANQFDIEHIVALGDAWQKGAQQWTKAKRTQLANDPINLMVADPSSNRAKGDADAATWLPKNKAYRCTYMAQQANVKKKYGIWVTKAERQAMLTILKKCI